jgi:signal transduction histidine kinase
MSFHEPEEISEVLVDTELIGLAISQLVENACKYSPQDAIVRLELGNHDGMAAVTVWNTGPSIPEGERDHIFERFYRGTEGRRIGPGSGLGLYVARKIALAHGGDLALVDDRTREVGFRLTVPFSTDEVSGAERGL